MGQFTMYLSAISQFSDAMNAVMQNVLNIKQFNIYYNELEKYMNVPAKMREVKKLPLPEGKYRIEFKNVFFRYPGQSYYTLKNINITIENGEKSENGAEKTTFIKLLVRLYDPTSGSILLKVWTSATSNTTSTRQPCRRCFGITVSSRLPFATI